MNSKKVVPIAARPGERTCPICGKPSYSVGGIHPQCAMQHADAPRKKSLKEEKLAGLQGKSKAKKMGSSAWNRNKKRCPKCGAESHVRKKLCDCGHDFFGT